MNASGEGIVYLVGAGPGDPRLATVRAIELVEAADVILYDRLVPPACSSMRRADAERIYVGKEPGRPSVPQEEISRMLVEHGSAGRVVVRLKGGDPFVFGRGGEEAEALAEAGVRFEVVPGVTAGVAAPAYAGIPVTHRDEASAVAFVTAHEDPAKPESALDWAALAAFPGTLVFYMGVRALPVLAAALVEHGRPSTEPAAVVERGTLPGQRTVTGPLEQIADAGAGGRCQGRRRSRSSAPVAALRDRLAWLERAPLFGRRVAVTRARAQASGLARRLEELGAEVVEAPAIRIEPRADGVQAGDRRAGHGPLRRPVPHEPQRRGAADGWPRPAGARRARARRHEGRRHRPGHGGGAQGRGASRRTWCPRARSRSRSPRS